MSKPETNQWRSQDPSGNPLPHQSGKIYRSLAASLRLSVQVATLPACFIEKVIPTVARNISKTLDTRCRELLALTAAMLEQAKAEQWDSLENALAKRQALLELTTAELLEEAQEVEHYRATLQKVKDFNSQIAALADKEKETARRDLLAVNKTSKAAKSYQQSAATDD